MKKIFNFIGLSLIAIFWLLVIGLRIDDPLANNVERFMAGMPTPTSNAAFEYGYGFDAPLGEDPAKVGVKWFEEYRETLNPPAKIGAIENVLEKNCITNYMQCFINTLYHLDVGELDDEKRNTLIVRYQRFWHRGPYVPLLVDSAISQPTLPVVFYDAHRLNLMSELKSVYDDKEALAEDYVAAFAPVITTIYQDITNLRSLLSSVNDLYSRYRVMLAISDNINALAMIKIILDDIELSAIEPLEKDEISIRRAAETEMANVLQFDVLAASAKQSSEVEGDEQREAFDRIFAKLFYPYLIKKNMLANFIFTDLSTAVDRSEMEPQTYYSVAKSTPQTMSLFTKLRGGISLPSKRANYDVYIAQGFMLDQKISLFNTLMVTHNTEAFGEVVNPLYGRKGSVYLEEYDGRACLPQPIEDEALLGCLPVKVFREH